MYYTQSTDCQGGFLNKFLISSSWAYAGFAKGGGGGGGNYYLGGACFPKKIKFNGAIWCVLEHIFIIFLLSKSLNISFLYKNNYKL